MATTTNKATETAAPSTPTEGRWEPTFRGNDRAVPRAQTGWLEVFPAWNSKGQKVWVTIPDASRFIAI